MLVARSVAPTRMFLLKRRRVCLTGAVASVTDSNGLVPTG